MNLTEISQKYPISFESLENYVVRTSVSQVSDAIKKIIIAHLQPRSLFDFFDGNNIFVSIVYIPDDNNWRVMVDRQWTTVYASKAHENRKVAEEDAVLMAFSILEDELTRR